MFDYIAAWIGQHDGWISVSLIPLQTKGPSIVPNFVAAAVTFLAAFFSFWLTLRRDIISRKHEADARVSARELESENRRQERLKAGAAEALSGFFKLQQWVEVLGAIKQHIDAQYADKDVGIIRETDPFLVIGPTAGKLVEPDRLFPAEFSFLLTADNSKILSAIGLLERRAVNSSHLFTLYSTEREALNRWQSNLPGYERTLDGPLATEKIPAQFVSEFNFRGAQLNRLIVGLIEHLDEDFQNAVKTTQQFLDAAHTFYAPHFPKIEAMS
ncbi:hypothetical protein GCM10010873_16640 [Cypionkella aquatica]|uniref:Uncharacterized protein n=1 Tax=Cypionkella aquatica TaxID=1756042 RepID=A0AA37X1D2_9RHOB|nr:hypothetical protein [Cypionkella aquatica]GLS86690.1 hypothetical protein GCM10010873_16640 [Cypionkella aquatica]